MSKVKDKKTQIQQHSVVWVDLPEVKGNPHLQFGVKPCVIVSNDKCNAFSPVINVMPITSSQKKPQLPTHYKLDDLERKKAGLTKRSMLLGESVRPVARNRVLSNMGYLTNTAKEKVNMAIKVQFGIN